jgi:iron complex outermembrane receptor protein
VTSSPVQQLDSEQLTLSGVTRVEDVLASLPQISLDQSSGQAIESIGTATLELRQLGASRTLVLLNGRRLPTNSPADTTSGADINFIPMQLVKRVEVLTGGASSTYGADAVAGVVNFIMIDDFEGVKLDYQFSQNRHDNSGNLVSRAATDSGFPSANDTANDGDISDMTFIIGGNLNEGRGNITAYATYRDIDGVAQEARSTSACAIGVDGDDSFCFGSFTNESGSFYFENDGFNALYHTEGDQWLPSNGPTYNFAPPSYSQRPDERYTLGAMGHYELNEHVEVYSELMFMDTRSTTQFGPAGVFFNTMTMNCGNPYMSAQQKTLVGCDGMADDEEFETIFGRRNVEGGPRFGDLHHDTFRILGGLRGDINETWRYDVSYQYAEVSMNNRNGNYVNVAKADNALVAETDGAGNVVCSDDGGGFCVPWNIFQTDGVTDEQVGYYGQQYFETGTTDQEVWSGYVQGNLGDYGIKLPWAESGIAVVIGAEYREQNLSYKPDDSALAGAVGGLGAALTAVDGGYDVTEGYMEANIPIIEGWAWAQAVTLDIGYRYSDYDPSGETTDTYKFAGAWDINEQVKLRGSFQRAVRAPNVVDQFQPVQGTLFAMSDDPCGGVVNGVSQRGYTFEQCARSGVTQGIWDAGGPNDSPANQYNTIIGGSTELSPEESDTYTAGFILTPNFAEGLTVSVDWYNIDVQDAITEIEAETTLLLCIETGAQCGKVGRGTNDTLWLGLAEPGNGVEGLTQNIGFFEVTGVDVEISYNLDMGEWGNVLFNNIFGYVDEWKQEEYPGAGEQKCEGVYGGSCELPLPENQNRFSATWATPWDVTANLTWRYLDSVDNISCDTCVDIDSQDYLDISAIWNVTDYASLRAGMNNVFDEDPPFVPNGRTARENGNTYPGIYDPLGQYWFVGASLQF